jgi:hypothetical protein
VLLYGWDYNIRGFVFPGHFSRRDGILEELPAEWLETQNQFIGIKN